MFKKLIGLLTASLMAIVGLVAMPIAMAPAQAAPPASAFDPGLIISDSVFFDFGSMTVTDIQKFLDSRVSACRSTDPAIDCLKSIKSEIPDTPATTSTEVGPCAAIPANPAASAAEVIYSVAVACGINPKVLITKLQKEQGLVTSTKPTSYMYRAAMGFGCPDSDPGICGKVYVGLFNQLYRAAKQLRWYGNPEGSFTYWKPGRTVSMRYNPKSSCGTKSFELKNQATANLYYYTPYTPNQAALDNMYGSGDSCSAYGNRNFWRYYHDWFGSPIGGGYLLQAAGTETFLIVNDKKFLVSDSRLLAALRPLGPIGEISSAYLDSFTTSGEATQLVSDSDSGAKFLLVDGIKYSVADCQIAAHFGANCGITIALSSLQLSTFIDGGALTRLVKTEDGNRYWIENASSRVVVDDLALQTVGGQAITATPMTIEQLVSVSPGAALASESVMFTVAGSAQKAIASGGKIYLLDSSLVTSMGIAKWFDQAPLAIDLQAIESTLVPDQIKGFIASESGQTFVITSTGKLPVEDPENWTDQVVTVPEAFLAKMPTANWALSAPAVVTSSGNKSSYFVQSAELRTSSDKNMIRMFLSLLGQPKEIYLPQSAINTISKAGAAVAPGAIVKSSSSSTRYLVDGLTNKIKLASSAQAASVSKSKTLTLSSSELAGLKTRTGFTSGKVQCDGAVYLLDGGILYPTSSGAAAEFPGSVYPLSTITCAALRLSTDSVGQFIRNRGTTYLIQDGTKRRVSSRDHLASLQGDGPSYIEVTNYFSDRIPTGKTAPATVELASLEGIPAGDFGELNFVGTVPEVIKGDPKPTPESTPNPNTGSSPGSAGGSETEGASEIQYRVVSGDSLGRIASKFSVTTARLQEYNSISNPNLIRVGQLIRIPNSGTTSQQAPEVVVEPEPAPEPEPTATVVEYRVQSGDTLLRIASKFGISSSALQSFNSISNPNRISIGQLLKIPTSTDNTNVAQAQEPEEPEVQNTYTVVSGDTIWGISRKLGISSSALARLNGINNSNFIRIGQVLKVPS